jgi:hypothetical protein
MIERSLKDAIKQFRQNIEDSDYANLGAKGKYLTVPYRIKFVRDYFGERMSIQTESTELANGSHKFKANIYIDDKLVSVGESKQMKNSDKEFEKQQTVSIGRGLSILGFFGDELATAEEMEQFLKPQKTNPIFKAVEKEIKKTQTIPSNNPPTITTSPNVNLRDTKVLADEWIGVMQDAAKNETSVGRFEKNLNPLRKEYLSELHQINSDLIQQQRVDQEEVSLHKQINNRKK